MITLYEGFLSKLYKKIPGMKLATIFVDFFNSIDTNNNYYHKIEDGYIAIYANKFKLIYIRNSNFDKNVNVTFFTHHITDKHIDMPRSVVDFILHIFNSDIIDFYVEHKDIDKYEVILTKENYEQYLIETEASKYNL